MSRSNDEILRIEFSNKQKNFSRITNMEYDFTFSNECACSQGL